MTLLHVAQLCVLVVLGFGACEVGSGHGEAIGEEVGEAENDHDTRRQIGADDARHDGEGGDGPVDAAIDPITEVADMRAVVEALGDLTGRVAVFKPLRQNSFLPMALRLMCHAWRESAIGASLPSHSHFNRLYSGDLSGEFNNATALEP